MDRRNFLKKSGMLATAWAGGAGFGPMLLPVRLSASEGDAVDDNPNLADGRMGATPSASSVSKLSPFSFVPTRVFGDNMNTSWESDMETRGAWLEVNYTEEKTVGEIWLLAKPLPYDIVFDPYTRGGKMQTPRRVTCSLGGGASVSAELSQSTNFQIIAFPRPQTTKSVRITIDEIWPEAGCQGTGIGKVRIYARRARPYLRSLCLYHVRRPRRMPVHPPPSPRSTRARKFVTPDCKFRTGEKP